jgi:hypothetical protein
MVNGGLNLPAKVAFNFDSEKIDQDDVFTIRHIIFLLRKTQVLHIQNIIFGLVALCLIPYFIY